MQVSRRINVGIKLFLSALFVAGFVLFGFARIHSAVHAASSQPTTRSSAVSTTCGSWNVVASPNVGTRPSFFNAVTAISTGDVWAVGAYDSPNDGGGVVGTLIEHWDGKRWSITSRPFVYGGNLQGVAALASNNVWAVGGYYNTTIRHYQTLIEHWDGSSWSVANSPNPSNLGGQVSLDGVAAISANDIWAVGIYQLGDGDFQTLVEHWDGTQWSIIASPDVAGSASNYLFSVAAVSSNNVWAVGMYFTNHVDNVRQTLVEHWDGMQWSIIASANPGAITNVLNGVSVISANNIWAVGAYVSQQFSPNQTLVEHWDGMQWSVVSSPDVGSGSNQLSAIATIASKNIWAVGGATSTTNPNGTQTLIEHWDGTQWSVTSSPSPGTFRNTLNGVVHVPGTGQIWAVGFFENGNEARTLAEFYC